MEIDNLLNIKDNPDEISRISRDGISALVSLLDEKNDDIRYAAFLTLQKRSELSSDIYQYWDILADKLKSTNSYQRSIGIMLIAENVKWDSEKRFSGIFDEYMSHCRDEKFVTSRQTIQGISKWCAYAKDLLKATVEILISIDIGSFKDTQRKLILTDILNALLAIKAIQNTDGIDGYIYNAMICGILDKKTIKQFEKRI